MTTLSYANVTQAQIDKMKPELIKNGAKVTEMAPNTFTIDGHNGIFLAAYNPALRTLAVEIQKQPTFWGIPIPDSEVDSKLKAALAA